MSMQVDFTYPRQKDDVRAIEAAVRQFGTQMNRMMVLMKELGNVLEGVSASFDALTSLSFTNDAVKTDVRRFFHEVCRLKEGRPFQEYNTRVHEEVLVPVQSIQQALKETKSAAAKRDHLYKRYRSKKEDVDQMERRYAKRNKTLEISSIYDHKKSKRESSLMEFRSQDSRFQESFFALVGHVESITQTTRRRYLELNAAYMMSVVEALVNTDPTIDGALPKSVHQQTCTKWVEETTPQSVSISGAHDSSWPDTVAPRASRPTAPSILPDGRSASISYPSAQPSTVGIRVNSWVTGTTPIAQGLVVATSPGVSRSGAAGVPDAASR